jgi:dynein heavy chain
MGPKLTYVPHGMLIILECAWLQILAEDRVRDGIRDFVITSLGPDFAVSPPAAMADVFSDMDNKIPCIFILSQGADPAGILFRFADERGFRERLHPISLGQGQAPKVWTALVVASC